MQKEQLSALMDGETLDSELLNELAHNPEMQKTWESYHLIRDSMRGDTPEVLHFDISSRAGCGSRVLNKLGPQTTHTIVVPCDEPLVPGQKVELGIAEGSLLSSALLVYMSPLVGLFLIASLFQLLFASDVAALCGAILGGIGGFLIARGYSRKFAARAEWQPIILSVALPPGLVRFETSSEDASQ